MTKLTVNGIEREFDVDNPVLPDWVNEEAFTSGGYPYAQPLSKKIYAAEMHQLQLELVKLQTSNQKTGKRVMIVFEGRDAAGKGGTINAFRANLSPRHTQTVALTKPTETEQGQWYYQRYVEHFPTTGDFLMFDRSWYNRAGVEPVMGFCTQEQHMHFLEQTPKFEKMIVDEGIAFFKIWLNVGHEMQLKRFHARRQNPLKVWKLSPIDRKAMAAWDAYTIARDQMLAATHTEYAPWTIVRSNDKKRARLNAIRDVLSQLEYEGKDPAAIGEIDPKICGQGPQFLNSFGA